MKSTLSYPIYIYLLHNWKHGFDKTDCVLFLPFSLHTYVCVCFVWEERFFILGLNFMDNKDPISKYSRVLSLGSWLSVPGNSPLKTRRISSADTRRGSCPPYRPCGQTISHLVRAKFTSDQVKPSPRFCY